MEERSPGQPEPMRRRPVVVFADDEPKILIAVERTLRGEPYDLHLTTDPEKALEWIRTRSVSVLVTDYRMPEMDGTTLLQLTQADSPGTARILLTAYPYESAALQGRATGLLTLLGKPWDSRELKRIIHDRLREREFLEGV
jgi:DNA-binding NtrC family response regulator